jgi:hypothetical protein
MAKDAVRSKFDVVVEGAMHWLDTARSLSYWMHSGRLKVHASV